MIRGDFLFGYLSLFFGGPLPVCRAVAVGDSRAQHSAQLISLLGQGADLMVGKLLVQQRMDQAVAFVLPGQDLIQKIVRKVVFQKFVAAFRAVADVLDLGIDGRLAALSALHVGIPQPRVSQDGLGSVLHEGIRNEHRFQIESVRQSLIQPPKLLCVIFVLLLIVDLVVRPIHLTAPGR